MLLAPIDFVDDKCARIGRLLFLDQLSHWTNYNGLFQVGWAVTGLNDSTFLNGDDQASSSESESTADVGSKAEKLKRSNERERAEVQKLLGPSVTRPRALLVLPAMVPARAFRRALANRNRVSQSSHSEAAS